MFSLHISEFEIDIFWRFFVTITYLENFEIEKFDRNTIWFCFVFSVYI